MPFDAVRVVLGDTDATPFGLGAFASRQAVIGGGAALRAARARARQDRAHRRAPARGRARTTSTLADGRVAVQGRAGRAPCRCVDVARVAHLETHRLPPDVEPGLDATRFYDPIRGTFAAGAQAADRRGRPRDGRDRRSAATCASRTPAASSTRSSSRARCRARSRRASAAPLTEHLVYDDAGQLLTGTLMEYALPTAAVDPARSRLDHVEEPADNLAGVRGVGEGGTLGPAAVLANAVADALAPFGVEPNELPLTPARLWAACAASAGPVGVPATPPRPSPGAAR